MKCRILVIVLFFSCPVLAQERLSYQQAHADIDYYFKMIDSIHPNMYWHTPKERVDSFIVALKSKCRDSIDIERLGVELQQSNHFFDYHSVLRGGSCNENINENAFPRIIMKNDKIYLKAEGYEILSINDVSIDEILRTLLNAFPLELHPGNILFDINYRLVFQRILMYMNIFPPYSVCIKREGKECTILKQGENYSDMKDKEAKFLAEFYDYGRPYSFEISQDSSLAIIHFNQCVGDETSLINLHGFLTFCFYEIEKKQIRNLFIDVSRNGGGSTEACDVFFPFIQNPKRHVFYSMSKKTYWNEKGKRRKKNIVFRKKLVKRKQGFGGKIFIYQSPCTASAAPYLCEILRCFDLAVLVGTDTEPVVNKHGNVKYFVLPNSNLGGRYARTYTCWTIPRLKKILTPQKGLKPDIPYPFLKERRLDFSDCMKIVNLYKDFGDY